MFFGLIACSSNREYFGIELNYSGPPTEVQQLAQLAATGDKQAQLQLGVHFEEGEGVEQSYRTARELYSLAAEPIGGVIYVYRASITEDDAVSIATIDLGPRVSGLSEAARRISELDRRTLTSPGISDRQVPFEGRVESIVGLISFVEEQEDSPECARFQLANCTSYRIHLSRSSHNFAQVIYAFKYYDENGHPNFSWPVNVVLSIPSRSIRFRIVRSDILRGSGILVALEVG